MNPIQSAILRDLIGQIFATELDFIGKKMQSEMQCFLIASALMRYWTRQHFRTLDRVIRETHHSSSELTDLRCGERHPHSNCL